MPYEKANESGMSEIVAPFDIFLNIESSGILFCEVLAFQNEGCGDLLKKFKDCVGAILHTLLEKKNK